MMNRLVRVELLKLHTIRATYGLALTGAVITGLFASLEATRAGRRVAPISTTQGLETVSTATGVAMILAAVLGVLLASGEYRHTTATLTYLATPRRSRVLGAKAIAAASPVWATGSSRRSWRLVPHSCSSPPTTTMSRSAPGR